MSKQLGVVVIGQAPRRDVEAQMRAVLPADVAIELRGALDGLTWPEIDALRPADGMDTLFTRLPDGSAVKISKRAVEAGAARRIAEFVAAGTTVTMLCCTGHFPSLAVSGPVLLPSAVLAALAESLLSRGRLGLLLPLPEQVDQLSRKWRRPGVEVVAVPLLPGSPAAEIDAAADRMQSLAPVLVVLDCMSYDQETKDRLRRTLRAPVLLAVSAAARVAAEMLA